MKRFFISVILILFVNVLFSSAQTNQTSGGVGQGQVDQLKNQLKQIQRQLDDLAARPAPVPVATVSRGPAYMNMSFDTSMFGGWSTASDPSLLLEKGDHDPQQRGFSLRNAEIALDGAVDPYFKGFGNVVLKLDNDNQTDIELEEAYLLTTSLPGNMQLKAGQFYAEFGRQNPQHPHSWAFVDQPLALNRMFGPDGMRNVGARLSWLVPVPFYSEFLLGVFNGQGGTAFSFRDPETDGSHGRSPYERGLRGAGDCLFVPRFASSFDLTDQQTLVLGVSGAFGPNDSGPDTRTQIYGLDSYWKWKSANADAGFPFVAWQTEVLYRNYDAGADAVASLPVETLNDWGGYSQLLWGYRVGWVAGLRLDYVAGNNGAYDAKDTFRGERTRIAPNLTWYPSEFSKIRIQYNYDHGDLFGSEQSVWVQLEFMLGAHAAHKF